MKHRIWEIDALRGLVTVAMVIFHFFFDLELLGIYSVGITTQPWRTFAQTIGFTFIFLVGVSLWLSYNRPRLSLKSTSEVKQVETSGFPRYLRRGLTTFAYGLIITAVTYVFFSQMYVIFGVLHLIGLSIILAYPFLKLPKIYSLIAAAIIFAIGLSIIPTPGVQVDYNTRCWDNLACDLAVTAVGYPVPSRSMADYYPLIPWFAPVLLGISFGKIFYRQNKTLFTIRYTLFTDNLEFIGRNSLLIYLIHQPVILSLLHAWKTIFF